MIDKGQRATEKQMRKLVFALSALYSKAAKDLLTQIQAYITPFEKDSKKKKEQFESGEISESDYRFWLRCRVFSGDKWDKKVKALLLIITETNKKAMKIIRSGQIDTFADNANFYADELNKAFKIGFSFDIFDRYAVERILKDNPKLLPEKVLSVPKDMTWNRQKINNSVTIGIIQGESVPKIADRISSEIAHLNRQQRVNYARTAVTAAQNAGRIERMKEQQSLGIHVQKKWLATHDERVRDAHLHLDGQIREIDEPFDSDLGKIMYPADPAANPANVWNCRCCLIYHYPDIK